MGEGVALGSSYLLHELVGRGAMGQVYRATRRVDGAQLAVKVLRAELASDPGMVARFLQERTFLASLHHPHLVSVRDLVAEGETMAIVMDFVAGVDLRRYLSRRGALPVAEAIGLMVQVLDGLGAVHAAGIVHRDLKPGNVLVDLTDPAAPVARITDFGVARATVGAGLTVSPEAIGTLEYMAPELASGEAVPATDLYAIGVMLYELLWGRPPFRRDNLAAMVRAHLEEAPDRPEGVPDGLWDLLVALLAKDPVNRPRSPGEARGRLLALAPSLSGWSATGDQAPGQVPGHLETGAPEGPTVVRAPVTPELALGGDAGATRVPSRRRDSHPAPAMPSGPSGARPDRPRRSAPDRTGPDRRVIYLIAGGATAVLVVVLLAIRPLGGGGGSPSSAERPPTEEPSGTSPPLVTGPRAKLTFARLPGSLAGGTQVFVVIPARDGFDASDVPATVIDVEREGAGGTVDLEFTSVEIAKRLANEQRLGLVVAAEGTATTTTTAATRPDVSPKFQGPPGG